MTVSFANRWRASAVMVCALLGASCGGGAEPEPVTFTFRLRGLGSEEEFRIESRSPEFIEAARAQLRLHESSRTLFPSGSITSGSGEHNLWWHWHYTDVDLVDTAIEVCDGRPSMVEADLDYWLNTVKRFCPWSAYVHAEIRPL